LEILCERIDAAYRRGDLDLASAEALSAFAAATASRVPSEMSAESQVDKSLFDKKVQCSCCGSADLWQWCANYLRHMPSGSRARYG
jgi:hypothetical protein